jgi:hypothetical protein
MTKSQLTIITRNLNIPSDQAVVGTLQNQWGVIFESAEEHSSRLKAGDVAPPGASTVRRVGR